MNKFMLTLFNLADGQDEAEFQQWMKDNDAPVVTQLPSVDEYNLGKTVGMMGADCDPPYQYMEIIRINDFDQLGKDALPERHLVHAQGLRSGSAAYLGSASTVGAPLLRRRSIVFHRLRQLL